MLALQLPRILSDVRLDELDDAAWHAALQSLPHPAADALPLLRWMDGPLRRIYPFERCVLVRAKCSADAVQITQLQQIGADPPYLQQVREAMHLQQRGSLIWWLHHQYPFVIDERCPPAHTSAFELEEIRSFGLGRIAVHGALDIRSRTGTLISFCGVPAKTDEWHHNALQLIAPALSRHWLACDQTAGTKPQSPHADLSSGDC